MNNDLPGGIPPLDYSHLPNIPIIGKKIDEEAITLCKAVLAKLEKGELLNLAIVAEDNTSNLVMSYCSKLVPPTRLRAGLATLGTHIDFSFIQASAQQQQATR